MKNVKIDGNSEYIVGDGYLTILKNTSNVSIDENGLWSIIWPYDIPVGIHPIHVEGYDVNGFKKTDNAKIEIDDTNINIIDPIPIIPDPVVPPPDNPIPDGPDPITPNPDPIDPVPIIPDPVVPPPDNPTPDGPDPITPNPDNPTPDIPTPEDDGEVPMVVTLDPAVMKNRDKPILTTNCYEFVTENPKYYMINQKATGYDTNWSFYFVVKLKEDQFKNQELIKINEDKNPENLIKNPMETFKNSDEVMNVNDSSTLANTDNIEYDQCYPLEGAKDISTHNERANDILRLGILRDGDIVEEYVIDLITLVVNDDPKIRFDSSKNCLIITKQVPKENYDDYSKIKKNLDSLVDKNDTQLSPQIEDIFLKIDKMIEEQNTKSSDTVVQSKAKNCPVELDIKSITFAFELYNDFCSIKDETLIIKDNTIKDIVFMYFHVSNAFMNTILLGYYVINKNSNINIESILKEYGLMSYSENLFELTHHYTTENPMEYKFSKESIIKDAEIVLVNYGYIDNYAVGTNANAFTGVNDLNSIDDENKIYINLGFLEKIEYTTFLYKEGQPTHKFFYKDKKTYDLIIKDGQKFLIYGRNVIPSVFDSDNNELFINDIVVFNTNVLPNKNTANLIDELETSLALDSQQISSFTTKMNEIVKDLDSEKLKLLKDPAKKIVEDSTARLESSGVIDKYVKNTHLGQVIISLNEEKGIYLHVIDNTLILTQNATNDIINISKDSLQVPLDFSNGNQFFIGLEKNNISQKLIVMDVRKNIIISQNVDFLNIPLFPSVLGYSFKYDIQLCYDLIDMYLGPPDQDPIQIWKRFFPLFKPNPDFCWEPNPRFSNDIPNCADIINSANIYEVNYDENEFLPYPKEAYMNNFFCKYSPIEDPFTFTLWFKVDEMKKFSSIKINNNKRVLISDDVNGNHFFIDSDTNIMYFQRGTKTITLFQDVSDDWNFFSFRFNIEEGISKFELTDLRGFKQEYVYEDENFKFDLLTVGAQYSLPDKDYINFFKGSFQFVHIYLRILEDEYLEKIHDSIGFQLNGL